MKQLGIHFGLVFTLGVSSTALAYPPQCGDICWCQSYCVETCYEGTYQSSCGESGICRDTCRTSDIQATHTPESQEQQNAQERQDTSRDVCTEQAQRSASSMS